MLQVKNSFLTKYVYQYKWLILTLIVFGSIYCSISLVNHYNFRTYAFDLGIYNNALYDYSKFEINDNPVMYRRFDNILSDHLSFYHFIYAPFRFIMGSWTLLIFQILSILFGAIGIFKLIGYLTENKILAHLASVHFLSMWGIYSALSFDYHDNVVASMFVPWLFLAILNKEKRNLIIWTIVILLSKENMSLWLASIFTGIFLWRFKDRTIRKFAFIGAVVSLIYFVLAVMVVMPALVNEGAQYGHLKYSALGESPSEYIKTLLLKPKLVFSLLFENHSGDIINNGIKTELHYVILVSGGVALLYKPQFLVMLIPIYAQKLFHTEHVKWGINAHYSIEFAPILTTAFFVWINDLTISKKRMQIIAIIATFICLSVSFSVIDNRKARWYDPKKLRFWSAKHYKRSFNVSKVHEILQLIPPDAKVCAQNMLVPHLSFRDDIYTYPYMRDAEYIILLPAAHEPYPFSEENFLKEIEKLKKNEEYKTIFGNDEVIIFGKKLGDLDE